MSKLLTALIVFWLSPLFFRPGLAGRPGSSGLLPGSCCPAKAPEAKKEEAKKEAARPRLKRRPRRPRKSQES